MLLPPGDNEEWKLNGGLAKNDNVSRFCNIDGLNRGDLTAAWTLPESVIGFQFSNMVFPPAR